MTLPFGFGAPSPVKPKHSNCSKQFYRLIYIFFLFDQVILHRFDHFKVLKLILNYWKFLGMACVSIFTNFNRVDHWTGTLKSH